MKINGADYSGYIFLLFPMLAKASPPAMRLLNSNGVEEEMRHYIGTGKWIVINIWSPTSACVTELPQIKKIIARNPNVPVLGITLDFPSFGYGKIEILQNFLKQTPLDYPLFLVDMDQTSMLIGRRLVGDPVYIHFSPRRASPW